MTQIVRSILIAAALMTIPLALALAPSLLPASGAPRQSIGANAGSAVKGSLHRLDFRVEGASCVTCLRRTGQELRDTKGVIKADVSIYRPYWAIVIYDAKQTNLDRMKESVKNEHVKLADVEDKPIAAVPVIIVPKAISNSGPFALPAGAH